MKVRIVYEGNDPVAGPVSVYDVTRIEMLPAGQAPIGVLTRGVGGEQLTTQNKVVVNASKDGGIYVSWDGTGERAIGVGVKSIEIIEPPLEKMFGVLLPSHVQRAIALGSVTFTGSLPSPSLPRLCTCPDAGGALNAHESGCPTLAPLAPWEMAIRAVNDACPPRTVKRWSVALEGMASAASPLEALVFIEAARGLVYEIASEPELTGPLEAAREACVAVVGEAALEFARAAQPGALRVPASPVLDWRVDEKGTHEAWAGIHVVRIASSTIEACEGQTIDQIRLTGERELRKMVELQLKNARLALNEFDARTAQHMAEGKS